jgi:aspartyl-tRNA(Asn)/glutamyl-tRNA(Gln) amidotransferase subunit C
MSAFSIKKIAELARLKLTAEEEVLYTQQIQNILGHLDKLSQYPIEGVKPSAHPFEHSQVMRADETKPSLSQESMLMNAPMQRYDQVLLPKVVE